MENFEYSCKRHGYVNSFLLDVTNSGNVFKLICNFQSNNAKDTDNYFIKSDIISADLCIDLAYEKNQIVGFKNQILQSSQRYIKKLFDIEFDSEIVA